MGIFSQLLRKWFGLPDPICMTCEVLRDQLDESNRERKELLTRLMERDKPEPLPPPMSREELTPIRPQHVPWRVKQQMLEAEDRRTAQLLRDKARELATPVVPIDREKVDHNIATLEEELGVGSVNEVK